METATEGSEQEQGQKQISDTSLTIDRVALGGYFQVNIDEPKIIEQVDLVVDWASRNAGKDDPANLLFTIKKLGEGMGSPPMWMDRLTQLYYWVKIDNQINNLEKEKKAYEK